jgi:hypothetical protein
MLQIIRKSKATKVISVFILLGFLNNMIAPTVALALTSGPSLPEVQSFEPAETNQMVDLFSGDFTYNIPLFDLPGPNGNYPFNIAYHSGITMDQEASWVGLGWNLNVGTINRTLRGLPDDFNGQEIKKKIDMKQNITFGIGGGGGFEAFGFAGISGSQNIYYNNYKGLGMSTSFGASFTTSYFDGGIGIAGVGVGISGDSQNGSSLDFSGDVLKCLNGSIGINSRTGIDESMGIAFSIGSYATALSFTGNSSFFSNRTFSPIVPFETKGVDFFAKLKVGCGVCGASGTYNMNGFFNYQDVKHDGEQSFKSYGYLYMANKSNTNDVLDYEREKDGFVTPATPNLASPIYTYDYLNASAQGFQGTFRPHKKTIGHVGNPEANSHADMFSLSGDIAVFHYGVDASYGGTDIKQQEWDATNGNNLTATLLNNSDCFYKMEGELTSQNASKYTEIGGDSPLTIPISDGNTGSFPLSNTLYDKTSLDNIKAANYIDYTLTGDASTPEKSLIGSYSITNADGMRYVYGQPAYNNEQTDYSFSTLTSVQSNEGNKLVSDIGSKTTKGETEIDYKLANTDKYLNKTTIPKYAYSYMLTEVLGADYVDVNNNNIADDDDYGYWVKFNYTPACSNYAWRAPYQQAYFDAGLLGMESDNKAHFSYGEKEIYYLASAETKTHIAVFNTKPRDDAYDAIRYANNGDKGTHKLEKLENIKLYEKAGYDAYYGKTKTSTTIPTPIKTIQFHIDYSLCKGVLNSKDLSTGKLTLLDIKMWYKNNLRGQTNPYVFQYGNVIREDANGNFDTDGNANPGYDQESYDCWGNYRGALTDLSNPIDQDQKRERIRRNVFPYVKQFDPSLTESAFKKQKDTYANSWQLTNITMPSGSNIKIAFESDDYAYVQHKHADQMFYIDRLSDVCNGAVFDHEKNYIPDWDKKSGSPDQSRIYFNLDEPIPVGTVNTQDLIFNNYIKGLYTGWDPKIGELYQMYFKIRSKLKGTVEEFITGYANLEINKPNSYDVDQNTSSRVTIGGVQYYTKGYVTVKPVEVRRKNGTIEKHHPFAVAAWNFIKSNEANLITAFNPDPVPTNKKARLKFLSKYMDQFISMAESFESYCTQAFNGGWGSTIDPGLSVIRLSNPSKKKYGGGSRVRAIVMNDNWKTMTNQPSTLDNSEFEYGQVYDYTTAENGQTISSGVAAYEPLTGGEQNPLRWAKPWAESQPFHNDNLTFFEYPVNESLYPGESVGYSKVTVWSLATYRSLKYPRYKDVAGTGYSINEFYTYKDFPVLTYETDIQTFHTEYKKNHWGFGRTEDQHLTASQGYSIVLNDMNGKPKAVHTYGQPKGSLTGALINEILYNYQSDPVQYQNESVNELNNTADVLIDDVPVFDAQGNGKSKIAEKQQMGVNYDIFTDFRFASTHNTQGGGSGNVDVCPIIFPITVYTLIASG